jgi:hypothetical protein
MGDITERLRSDRKEYLRLRDRAEAIATEYENTDVGRAMSEQCRILEAAIVNVNLALLMSGDGRWAAPKGEQS